MKKLFETNGNLKWLMPALLAVCGWIASWQVQVWVRSDVRREDSVEARVGTVRDITRLDGLIAAELTWRDGHEKWGNGVLAEVRGDISEIKAGIEKFHDNQREIDGHLGTLIGLTAQNNDTLKEIRRRLPKP